MLVARTGELTADHRNGVGVHAKVSRRARGQVDQIEGRRVSDEPATLSAALRLPLSGDAEVPNLIAGHRQAVQDFAGASVLHPVFERQDRHGPSYHTAGRVLNSFLQAYGENRWKSVKLERKARALVRRPGRWRSQRGRMSAPPAVVRPRAAACAMKPVCSISARQRPLSMPTTPLNSPLRYQTDEEG